MTEDTKKVLDAALRLPPDARVAVAGSLLESLGPEMGPDAEARWAEEIARRVHELDAGLVKTIPWEEVRRTLHDQLGA